LLNEINTQLEEAGLKVESVDTAIVGATIIKSNVIINKTLEQQEDGNYEMRLSANLDTKWLKKGKKSYFYYQGFVRVD
jgi:hypothetical protein